ncbi:hypothetical protein SHI21_14615 [Bacteriovorax sp. PP10]|uniref:EcsC protein family protein n=1 Tax=Bacteriovorax antarcticus TaxID=3088717 RepID=A0ABU5VWL6_9BACT|nr:hypothetical protein [Bacteriovorax sp. PP10]MEA9357457.1 hypothetical protein [Bacteriovorax sp. PP10]
MQNAKISPQEFITLLQKLLNEKIPTDNLVALGAAIATLKLDDWKSVGGNIFSKDMKPIYYSTKKKIISLKELKTTIKKDGTKSVFKNFAENSKNLIRGSIQSARVNVPDAKDRLTRFTKKIATDYSHLKTNEDRGNYILKLSLYSGVFAMAFQKGARQKMLSKSTLPLIVLGVSLVFINRILEQAEEKLQENPGALKLSQDLRSLLRTLNMGFSSGMTFNVMVDGIVDQKIQINDLNGKSIGSLMPKSIIDNMIYTTLMSLFSTEKTNPA